MTTVAFQGENGAYSQEAARQFFGAEVGTLPCRSFEDIFRAVEEWETNYGILPIENSMAGSINKAYDLLLDYDLKIWGEVLLRVRHCLLANPSVKLEDIRQVRSHPQALAQCERFLLDRGMEAIPAYDTAGSAKGLAAAPEEGVAAIAAPMSLGEPTKITVDDLKLLTLPKLFVCADSDRYGRLPGRTQLMYDESPEPKQLTFFPGTAHGTELFFTQHKEELRQLLLDFLDGLR